MREDMNKMALLAFYRQGHLVYILWSNLQDIEYAEDA